MPRPLKLQPIDKLIQLDTLKPAPRGCPAPRRCPECEAGEGVRREQHSTACGTVRRSYRCNTCGHGWRVTESRFEAPGLAVVVTQHPAPEGRS